ncbi:MAG: HigA family addiction module antitoxin [Spirochaetota bacterium]
MRRSTLITITKAALKLKVSQKALSEFVNQKSSLSPEMARRIAQATKTTPESSLNMHTKIDLWKVLQKKPVNVSEFHHQRAVYTILFRQSTTQKGREFIGVVLRLLTGLSEYGIM